jgi:hypothetical protein
MVERRKSKRMGLTTYNRKQDINIREMMEEENVAAAKPSTEEMRARRKDIKNRGGTYGNTLFVNLWLQVYRSNGTLEDVKKELVKKGYTWLKDTGTDKDGNKVDLGLRNIKARAGRLRKKSWRKTKKGKIIEPRILVREAVPLPFLTDEARTSGSTDYASLIEMCVDASAE